MAAKKRGQASIRMLWAIAKSPELNLDKENLYAVISRETGKDSMAKLTKAELNWVADVLQGMKDRVGGRKPAKRTDEGGNPATVAQRRKIYALCGELGWNDNPNRIQGFVKRMSGIDRIEWLNKKQCAVVIEALKKMAARRGEEDGTDGGKETETHDAAREG